MSWRNIPRKENYMPLFAEDWNAVIDALDDLYSGKFGPIERDLVPARDKTFDLGKINKKWRNVFAQYILAEYLSCLLYTSPSPRDLSTSRMPSSA